MIKQVYRTATFSAPAILGQELDPNPQDYRWKISLIIPWIIDYFLFCFERIVHFSQVKYRFKNQKRKEI